MTEDTIVNVRIWAYIEVEKGEENYYDVGEPVALGDFATVGEANEWLTAHSLDGQGAVDIP